MASVRRGGKLCRHLLQQWRPDERPASSSRAQSSPWAPRACATCKPVSCAVAA